MSAATTDWRVCVFGDSLVHGQGDPAGCGWVGRVASPLADRHTLTLYNLGIRGDTAAGVARRWAAEATPRLQSGTHHGIVVAVGVNDAGLTDTGAPVPERAELVPALEEVLAGAHQRGWPVLLVGPPPVGDPGHLARIAAVDDDITHLARRRLVPHHPTLPALTAHPRWRAALADGDGVHPSGEGYDVLAALLAPALSRWLTEHTGGG